MVMEQVESVAMHVFSGHSTFGYVVTYTDVAMVACSKNEGFYNYVHKYTGMNCVQHHPKVSTNLFLHVHVHTCRYMYVCVCTYTMHVCRLPVLKKQ